VDFHDLMKIYYIPQYSIFFILVLIFTIKEKTTIRIENIPLFLLMFTMCVISYINGIEQGYVVNVKPFVLTLLLVFLLERQLSMSLLRKLVGVVVVILAFEYFIAYTQIIPYNYLTRSALVRPVGIFFGVHDLSYFLVFSLYAIGYTYISALAAFGLGSYQMALAWVFLVSKKMNKFLILIFIFILIFILSTIGHLNIEQKNSMIFVIIDALENAPVDYSCLILGCSNNVSNVFDSASFFSDFGFIRVFYQFGLIWILLLLYALRSYSKTAIFANIVLWLHYPVNLGILGFVFFIWILKYMKQKDFFENEIKNQNISNIPIVEKAI
jgi:hypothetical protein